MMGVDPKPASDAAHSGRLRGPASLVGKASLSHRSDPAPASGRKCQSRKYRGSLKLSLGDVELLESALHKAPPEYAETPGAAGRLTQLPFGDSASTMREPQ
jgi:hypothetical protein